MYFGLEVFIRYQGRRNENFKTKFVNLILHTKALFDNEELEIVLLNNYPVCLHRIFLWINS